MCLAKSFMQTLTDLTEGEIKIKTKYTAPYHVWVDSSSFKKTYKITTQHPENNNTLSLKGREKILVPLLWDSYLLFFITLRPSNYDNFTFNSFGPITLLLYRSPLLGLIIPAESSISTVLYPWIKSINSSKGSKYLMIKYLVCPLNGISVSVFRRSGPTLFTVSTKWILKSKQGKIKYNSMQM